MRIVTTAGELVAVQAPSGDKLYVRGRSETLQALVDGIEMSGGGAVEFKAVVSWSDGTRSMIVSKLQLAVWVQFEILNYLTYTELPETL